ncbi:MAG: hypothetical protein GY711_07105 [bacterium]|nr:hypothetical protein [bacterium]
MAGPNRNQACPCGSGRKFKKCCLGKTRGSSSDLPRARPGEYMRLRVTLVGASPPVWRQFLLRAEASFFDLHAAIQACGWEDAHLWGFRESSTGAVIAGLPSDNLFGPPDPDARGVRLDSRLASGGDGCVYVYDFGDDWTHEIVLEAVETHESDFERALVDGSGSFPPEDCGGISGFMRLREFLETGKDPWGDDETLREWSGGMGLDDFNLPHARRRFGHVLPVPAQSSRAQRPATEPQPASPERLRAIDEPAMEAIVQETKLFVAGLADRFGIEIALRKATYSDINARIELEVATVRDDGIVMDRHAEDFLNRCEEFGLGVDDLGREFQSKQESLRIVGLRPRAKQPVLCERLDRRSTEPDRVRMSAAVVRQYLGLVR